ncbi:MAG: hypothetical protein J7497_00255 [Chitinophagaceae bacterium]|nr:hypothetical protein [Chitinophagaceae bacterium]
MNKRWFIILSGLIFLLITLSFGCEKKKNVMKINNLKSMISFNNCLLMSAKEGYLFGESKDNVHWSGSDLLATQQALIYRTNNKGATWVTYDLGEGYMSNSLSTNGRIYASKICIEKGRILDSSIVYKLNEKAKNWEVCFATSKYIRDMLYIDEHYQLITANDGHDRFKLFESYNKGINWSEISSPFSIYAPIFNDKHVWYLTTEKVDDYHNILVKYDTYFKRNLIAEKLPAGFSGDIIGEYNKELYIAGSQNTSIDIYKRSLDGGYVLLFHKEAKERIFPKAFHVFGNEILLLYGKRQNMYVENCLVKSLDGGQTWKEEYLLNSQYADPIGFYNDSSQNRLTSWIYSGFGNIQVIN